MAQSVLERGGPLAKAEASLPHSKTSRPICNEVAEINSVNYHYSRCTQLSMRELATIAFSKAISDSLEWQSLRSQERA